MTGPSPKWQAKRKHTWLAPGAQFVGQWLWDTMFVVELLSVLPDQRDTIRGIFQNYWDFQERWNAVMPEYAHGMVANFIAPYSVKGNNPGTAWAKYPAYSQAPLLAWGMERVYRRNGDVELLRAGISHLEAFHEWYWRERDLHDVGLVCLGAYSDDVQHARYETYDNEVDLDGLTLTNHPARTAGGKSYGDICIPANTSYLLLSEASLTRMAIVLGDHNMACRRRQKLKKGIAAMRKHMWDDAQGCFLSVRRDSLEKIPVATIGGLVPLQAHIPTKWQAARMAEAIAGPHWSTPLPVPTVDRQNFRTMHSSLMSSIGVRPEVTRDNMGHANVDVTQNVYNRTWWEERVEAVSMAAATVWREFLAQPVPATRM